MSGRQAPKTARGEETRRKLLDSADVLFYEEKWATGVEALAEGAGVTKMTLYARFASKDDLVLAYLRERDRRWRDSLERRLERQDEPGEKLLEVFDAYREWLVSGGLRGCAYVNCAAEFPDREHPAREAVRSHKVGLRDRLMELAAEAGVAEPERLAENLFLLLAGSYVTGALEGNDEVIGRARSIAAELVASSIEDGGRRPT